MRKVKLRSLAALLVVALALGCWVGAANAGLSEALNQLRASGLDSNTEISQTYVDLSNAPSGTVTSVTYIGASQIRTDNSYTVTSQTYSQAMNRVTSFVFELSNNYRPETSLGLTGIMIPSNPTMTTCIYTYGTLKDQAMYAVVSGLEQCLNSDPIRHSSGSSSSSWVQEYYPETMASKVITSFKIGEATYSTTNALADTTTQITTLAMDVSPYEKDGRSYVPVRFLAYACGVSEDNVQWDEATQTVTIIKDDTTLKLTIGSTILTKNKETIIMDVAPEIIDPGRTMLPARWVSEALGATVTWDEKNNTVTIEILQPEEQSQ